MRHSKGQITMETIFIYGLIAIVVLSGIGALIYFGVFDLGSYLPDKCTFSGGTIECEQAQLSSVSTVGTQFGLKNTLNRQIDIIKISLEQTDQVLVFGSITPSAKCDLWDQQVSIPPKSNAAFPSGATPPVRCVINSDFKGQKVKLRITVEYKPTGGAITETLTGEVTGTVS